VADWWRKIARAERIRLACAVVVALLLVGGYEVQRHREGSDALARVLPLPTRGPAADLTAVQLGERPGPKSTLLRRINSLLELLEADCPGNTRRQLVDYALGDIQALRREGVTVTPNAVLGGVVGLPDIGATSDCAAFFRRFVQAELRTGG
jgi:hypothetical protein